MENLWQIMKNDVGKNEFLKHSRNHLVHQRHLQSHILELMKIPIIDYSWTRLVEAYLAVIL